MVELSAPGDLVIDAIAYDSRRVERGTLFVAIPSVGGDETSGGHLHLPMAKQRGAAVAVIQGGPAPAGLPWVRVADSRAALADLAAEFYGHPSRELRLFGVTGTDGKTTTTYLLEQLLALAGHRTGLIGTIELKIADERLPNSERSTTPESLDLQRLLRRMANAGVTHVAMEVSSHGLALQRVRGCSFTACALTNITGDHLEFHGSWDAYFRAKLSLFTRFAAGKPAVLNRDAEHFAAIAADVTGPVLDYGLGVGAELRADDLQEDNHSTRCRIRRGAEQAITTVPLPGEFNVSNALAAIGLALIEGLSLDCAARYLAQASPPPGRLQRVTLGQPFDVLIDYGHTIHAFRSVLAGLRRRVPPGNRVIAVFGAMGDRDRGKRPILAQIARRYTDYFYITNEDPAGEDAGAIIEEIAAGVPAGERGIRFDCVLDRRDAILAAIRRAAPGDTVIILGKGHEQSILDGTVKLPWSDEAVAREALALALR